jgi:Na+/H+ antiporter NhaD/arsenite permease-like protein
MPAGGCAGTTRQAIQRQTMNASTTVVLVVFAAVYTGMAFGRWPGLRIDRSGIAVLGAIALYASGIVDGGQALAAIDFPTLAVLFGLMILSAQFAACGFYDRCSARIAAADVSPSAILALTVAVSGTLSAVLANDIVVFAMTPMMIRGLQGRGLDPRPFLIGLAGGANAGSAATVIGNPQNILIGQVGQLEFWSFAAACAPPALVGLACVYAAVRLVWRETLAGAAGRTAGPAPLPALDRTGAAKAFAATAALLVLFATDLPQVTGVLAVAALLLVSRRRSTGEMFRTVDWQLILLFGGLFVVTAALAATGIPRAAVEALVAAGIRPDAPGPLAVVALAASNVIGNVPAVMLLLGALPAPSPGALHALAVLSTLAGNLLIVGSVANIIVAERARDCGVVLGFREHAKCGVPMTLASVAFAVFWFAVVF